jgi:hypothetical protein
MEQLRKKVERANNKNKVISKTDFSFRENPLPGDNLNATEKALHSVLDASKTVSAFNQTFNESQKSKSIPITMARKGTHQFKYIDREKSLKVSQYYYPKD